jgi:hypothetical protein
MTARILPFRTPIYEPPNWEAIPETPPQRRRISAFFAYWLGFASCAAAFGAALGLGGW